MAELIHAPFPHLLRRMVRELQRERKIFDLPARKFCTPPAGLDLGVRFHGRAAGNPLGPAAGPHDQMAQNLVLAWLGTQLIAQDYIGSPLLVKSSALEMLGSSERDAGTAFTYDLLLRALSAGLAIERIPEVLAARSKPPSRGSAKDRQQALQHWVRRSKPGFEIRFGATEGAFRLHRRFDDFPHVTLVIPTCQTLCPAGIGNSSGSPYILNLLNSLSRTRWRKDRLTVIVGDDVGEGSLYECRSWPFELKRVVTTRLAGERFNYPRKMNRLWPLAESEYVVLMNDDLAVQSDDWLEALMTFASNGNIGGMGARLLDPDRTLQHGGMAGGVMVPCVRLFRGLPDSAPTYQHWADVHREWSIVTGAVFATRKSLLELLNGFDESFSLDYSDVDMCLRMRMLGYRIVYTPHAELTKFESGSRRGSPLPGEEVALFIERWSDYLRDDPAYHPRLSRDTWMASPVLHGDEWWLRLNEPESVRISV